jgi:hypothetical protein
VGLAPNNGAPILLISQIKPILHTQFKARAEKELELELVDQRLLFIGTISRSAKGLAILVDEKLSKGQLDLQKAKRALILLARAIRVPTLATATIALASEEEAKTPSKEPVSAGLAARA